MSCDTGNSPAQHLGKPQSYVSKVEILERRLDAIELIDWLHFLEMDISIFIKGLNDHRR